MAGVSTFLAVLIYALSSVLTSSTTLGEAARNRAAKAAHAVSTKAKQWPLACVPCTPNCPACSVEGPFGASGPPLRPVTADDIRRANAKAYIEAILQDEDKRIESAALIATRQLQKQRQAKRQEELNLKRTKAVAAMSLMKAKQQAAWKLGNATATLVEQVASQARMAGAQEQLARDQQAFAKLLYDRAQASQASAQNARSSVQLLGLKHWAAQNVSADALNAYLRSQQVSQIANTQAKQDLTVANQQIQAAYKDSTAASAAMAFQKKNEADSVQAVTNTATRVIDHAMQAERSLVTAAIDPKDFVRGVAASTGVSQCAPHCQ